MTSAKIPFQITPAITATTAGAMRVATPLSQHEQLVKQTHKWVAETFFGTMLKQMRESPFKSDLLDGGRGGQAFSSLYDQHLSERMMRGTGTKLVNAIVRKIEAKSAYAKQSKSRDEKGGGESRVPAAAVDRARAIIPIGGAHASNL